MAQWAAQGVTIGRRTVDLSVPGSTGHGIAYKVHREIRTRRLLLSRDYEVQAVISADGRTCRVEVTAGARLVGAFSLENKSEPPPNPDLIEPYIDPLHDPEFPMDPTGVDCAERYEGARDEPTGIEWWD